MSHITVLAGGLSSAKFLAGLVEVLSEEQVQVIVNVGDDYDVWGVHVSPDIDFILYALAGELDPTKGWTPTLQSFQCYERARKLGFKSRFKIEDRDLATHLLRTSLLQSGQSLEEATNELADRFGLGLKIMPATNNRIQTLVETADSDLLIADFYEDVSVEATGVRYEGADVAAASDGVIESIMSASRVILPAADPIRSIGAILAIPAIRDALVRSKADVVAVSPVIGSQPMAGLGDGMERLMHATGTETISAPAICGRYKDFLNQLVIHTTDLSTLEAVRGYGVGAWVENILISNLEDSVRLAGRIINEERSIAR